MSEDGDMSGILGALYPDTPVLVAVVTNQRDLDRALAERWYRIPVAHAPRPVAAELLALYQTGTFGPHGRVIRYIAPITAWQLRRRREILPEEPDHRRANESYYCLCLGPSEELSPPIPSSRLRRITFIRTTLERLRSARDVRDLWLHNEAQLRLCENLRAEGFAVANRQLREREVS